MDFIKYQHVERFGNDEVLNIELGTCYLFPKIDGTNGSVWFDGENIRCASRRRSLKGNEDNAGFMEFVLQDERFVRFFTEFPELRLFGEWLVPHSLKTYRDNAWKKFYIFDVTRDKDVEDMKHEGDDRLIYLPFDEYEPILNHFGFDYVSPLAIIDKPDYEKMVSWLDRNQFLIKDGEGCGEGIVIKNYSFYNKYNRQVWAKIVRSEFKELHTKEMGAPEQRGKDIIEEYIVNKFCTETLISKVYERIKQSNSGWTSKHIPQLLNTVYYDFINEEMWNILKKCKSPTINFKTLNHFMINKIKETLPNVF